MYPLAATGFSTMIVLSEAVPVNFDVGNNLMRQRPAFGNKNLESMRLTSERTVAKVFGLWDSGNVVTNCLILSSGSVWSKLPK